MFGARKVYAQQIFSALNFYKYKRRWFGYAKLSFYFNNTLLIFGE